MTALPRLLAALLLPVTLTLAACGGGDAEPAAEATPDAASSSPAPSPSPSATVDVRTIEIEAQGIGVDVGRFQVCVTQRAGGEPVGWAIYDSVSGTGNGAAGAPTEDSCP